MEDKSKKKMKVKETDRTVVKKDKMSLNDKEQESAVKKRLKEHNITE